MRVLAPLLFLALSACWPRIPGPYTDHADDTGLPDTDTDVGTDPDTDPDTLPDTDSGTEPDTDPDTAPQGDFSGTVQYRSKTTHTTSGSSETPGWECDSVWELSGTASSGYCEGCTWVQEIDSSLTSDASTEACPDPSPWQWTWSTDATALMAHAPSGTIDGQAAEDILLSGIDQDFTSDWHGIAWDGHGSLQLADDTLSWDITSEEPSLGVLDEACPPALDEPIPVDGPATSDALQPCAEGYADLWTFDAGAGEQITVTVDTNSAENTWDPALVIRDADTCTRLQTADDEVECTFPPPTYDCPEVTLSPEGDRTYLVQVYTRYAADCGTNAGTYELTIEGAAAPNLALTHDDYTEVTTIESVGSGQFAE